MLLACKTIRFQKGFYACWLTEVSGSDGSVLRGMSYREGIRSWLEGSHDEQ